MPNRRAVVVGLGVLFLVAACVEHAWPLGDLGHKVACEIAFQERNDEAASK
jgi:hypothetical protein